jgi:tetratricopeptide (TPR) repeat protein
MNKFFNKYSIVLFVFFYLIQFSAHAEMGKELTKAVYLVKSGDHKLAIKFCNQVLQDNPGSVQAHYIKGFAFFKLEEYAQAIESFDKTIDLEPGYADAFYYRGICKRQSGKLWGAFQDLRKANSLNPEGTKTSLYKEVIKALF